MAALGRAIGLFALLGLCVTLVIHIAALNGVVLLDFWEVQSLILGMAFTVVAAILRGACGKRFGFGPASLRAHPRWLLAAAALLVAYALVDFFWNLGSGRQDWAFSLRQLTGLLMCGFLFPVLLFLRPPPAP